MSKPKHTPGPLVVKGATIQDINGRIVAVCPDYPGDNMAKEQPYNARLIAAAPEMLEALENIVKAIECASNSERLVSLRTDVLKLVIAKAKGGVHE